MKDRDQSGFRSYFKRLFSAPVLLVLILAIGLGLRLYKLLTNELWLDEAHSIFIAGSSLAETIENLKHDSHPPLYFALMLAWKGLFGESELSVRMLSVAFGMASLGAVYWLGSRLVNQRLGLAAAFIAAIAPLHVYYSQEARMYIMLAFFSSAAAGLLWLAVKHDKKRYWWAYTLAAACLVYTHVFGWFVLPAANAFLLIRKDRRLFKKLLFHQAIVMLLFLPWVPILAQQTGQTGLWMRPWWQATPPALAIAKTLECFGAGGNYPRYLSFFHVSPLRYVSYAVFALLGIIALAPTRDGSISPDSSVAEQTEVGSVKTYLLLNLLVPLLLPYAVSFVKPIYLVGRNDLIAYPFYALLIGIGLVKLARFAWVGVILISLLASYSFSKFYSIPNAGIDKETVEYLAHEAKEDDVVIVMGLRFCTIDYYRRREGARFQIITYPASMRQHPGWIDYRLTREELARDAVDVTVSAIADTPPGRPIWLLLYSFGLTSTSRGNRFEQSVSDQLNRHFWVLSSNDKLGVSCLRQKSQPALY